MTRSSAKSCVRVAAVALLAAGVALVASGRPAAAAPQTQTYTLTGGPQQFVVPADVCSVTVTAIGAAGGDWVQLPDEPDDEVGETIPGGAGGAATATLAVTPGETLQVNVGGRGSDAVSGVLTGAAGGFNGGAAGGDGLEDAAGAGGGGGSDVRRSPNGLADRLVVAGGGGGSGGGNDLGDAGDPDGQGGAGGGASGVQGERGAEGVAPDPAQGGGGGTQTAGGAAGVGLGPGAAGVFGAGGAGGDAVGSEFEGDGGGGGGGGYFGGGGGGAGGTESDDNEDAGGGGGGSGFTPDGTGLEVGVNADADGRVTITYDPDAGTCPASPAPSAGPIVARPTFTG